MPTKINYLAVLACVFVNMGLGIIWFGPLFAEKWMALNGLTLERVESMPTGAIPYITTIIGALVSGYMLSILYRRMGVSGWMEGAKTGAAIGLFPMLVVFSNYAFSLRPMELSWIDGGYAFVLFCLYGALIGGWQKR